VCSGAAGVENPQMFEEHICTMCCKLFPNLPREVWAAHVDDYCPHCGENRFKIVAGMPRARKR
jgi:predicted  nucleic acid-binding Zn-ribbon protein